MTERIGGVVLAGGRSSRFGSDKLAEPVDGRPLLHYAIESVRAVATDVVVVAAPDARPSLPAGTRLAHDPAAFEGPLAGLLAGLEALEDGVDQVIVVAGDMPDLVPAVLRRLLDQVASGSTAAVLRRDDDAPPLPLAVHRRPAQIAARELLDRGERRLRALPDALDAFVVPEATWRADDPTAATLRDIDTRADLAGAPSRARLLQRLADDVVAFGPERRVIVAVDGVDGAGKTIFADEFAAVIAPRRPVLRASVDDFHRPAVERYERGRHSPEGFFRDSYDYDTLARVLLDPFAAGGEVVAGVFDVVADAPRRLPATTPPADAVLILDGIFLHRAELVHRWDLSIFLDVPFSVSVPRLAVRDDSDPDPAAPSNRRYVEGQRLYLAESDPLSRATYVLDYNDLERPRVVRLLEGRQA